MSTKPIVDVTSKPEAIDQWGKVQELVARTQDIARMTIGLRTSPIVGSGAKFTGLSTAYLRNQLQKTDEVQGALAGLSSVRPIALHLFHPNKLSVITTGGEVGISLSNSSQKIAGELLNRIAMPKGSNLMQLRASWPFRSAILPLSDTSPIM